MHVSRGIGAEEKAHVRSKLVAVIGQEDSQVRRRPWFTGRQQSSILALGAADVATPQLWCPRRCGLAAMCLTPAYTGTVYGAQRHLSSACKLVTGNMSEFLSCLSLVMRPALIPAPVADERQC